MELAGKTALVTGAARRLGKACALGLARRGVHVVVHRNTSAAAARQVVEEIRALGVNAWAAAADLRDSGAPERLIAEALELAERVDILINNASAFPEDRLADCRLEDIEFGMRINAFAPFLLARGFAAQGREGAVVNFLDTRIVGPDPEHFSYHLSKRMLFTLTRLMSLEFAPRIRVNAIAPGLILPPEGKDERCLDALAHTNPLNTHGAADDVVGAMLFLLESDFITGQVVFVDGGRHMKGSLYG